MKLDLPDIQDYPQDPGHTAWDQWRDTPYEKSGGEQGGKTKINKTDMSGASSKGMQGYGFMTNDPSMMAQGKTTGPTLPQAKPIKPLMYGDPNNTAVDHKDGFSTDGGDTKRYV